MKIILIFLAFSVLANLVLGYLFWKKSNAPAPLDTAKLYSTYPYLSKRIFTELPNDIIINFIPLREAMRTYIESLDGTLGVYFEYLPSGTSIGVYDRDEVKLASLSKVPLAMSIYKKIERGKLTEDKVLVIKKEQLDFKFGSLWKKGEGTPMKVHDLIDILLTESDNTAYNVLFDELTSGEVNEVYENLDITINNEGNSPAISPKNYSSIFRSLYLSSFLSEVNSNKLLDILTQTKFENKITAGVPENIKVSHKIGVFERIDEQSLYTDCGIVFVPNRPYILCAFVRGTDQQAQEYISHVSKMIYEYVVKVEDH